MSDSATPEPAATAPAPATTPAAAPAPAPAPAAAPEKPAGDAEKAKSEEPPASPRINLKEQFKAFSKFGDTKSDGKHITLSQSDKWMKQAKVIDKTITTTDTAIHFKKFKSLKITLEDYKKFLVDLSKTKKVELRDIEQKLAACAVPGVHTAVANSKIDSTVERLTDTSRYTGSHKLRFDETGKGRGAAGRKDEAEKSGYVAGYQNKDSYNKTH